MTEREIDVPAGLAFLAQLMERAEAGRVTYLTHKGHRIATVVPADVVETVRRAFAEVDAVTESRPPTVEQLAREQGVQPVTDPAELRGPGMDEEEFRAFYEAVTSGRKL
jgi:antitoxin (DNA-binding transcriptional repressor) of toxin-antitoxin stability system